MPRPFRAREYASQYSAFDDPIFDRPDVRRALREASARSWSSRTGLPRFPKELSGVTKLVANIPGRPGIDGAPGAGGLNNALVFLFQRAASTPSLPGSTLTFTFATGVLSGTLGSWAQAIPAVNGNPCYVTVATASSSGATDTIASGEWAGTTILVQDGGTGVAGINAASVFLFKRAASAPSVPGATLTYTFSTGVLSGTLSGWTQAMPASDGNPCYSITATAAANTSTDTIATGEWSTPAILVQDGAQGDPGTGSLGTLHIPTYTVDYDSGLDPVGYSITIDKDGGDPSGMTLHYRHNEASAWSSTGTIPFQFFFGVAKLDRLTFSYFSKTDYIDSQQMIASYNTTP